MEGYIALALFGLWIILQSVNGPLVDKVLGKKVAGS